MAWFGFGKKEARAAGPTYAVSDPALLGILFGGSVSSTGIAVNVDVAMRVPAVFCATGFLAGTIASLPLNLFKREQDDRKLATSDPLFGIVHDVVNDDYLTSFQWRMVEMQRILLKGRSTTFIELNKAGRVQNLWPLDPDCVEVVRRNGRRFYIYRENGMPAADYRPDEIIDLPLRLKPDGLCHYDPITLYKDTIGQAVAINNYAAKFFENGGIPPLALHGPMPTNAAGVKRAAADVQTGLREAQNEKRSVLVLPAGHELKKIGVDPDKGQMIEARKQLLGEFSRWFNLPPVFLHDLERATFTNSEQQDLNLVKHTLRHWMEAWEAELNAKLFPPRNRKNFVEFDDDELLRGDLKSRMDAAAVAIQNGIKKPNEVRAVENLPRDPNGDDLLIQGATVPLGSQPAPSGPNNGDPNVGA